MARYRDGEGKGMTNDSQVRGRGKEVVKTSILPGLSTSADLLLKTYSLPSIYPIVQQCLLGLPGWVIMEKREMLLVALIDCWV